MAILHSEVIRESARKIIEEAEQLMVKGHITIAERDSIVSSQQAAVAALDQAMKPKFTKSQTQSLMKYVEGEAIISEAIDGLPLDFDERQELEEQLDAITLTIRKAVGTKGTLEEFVRNL